MYLYIYIYIYYGEFLLFLKKGSEPLSSPYKYIIGMDVLLH